MNLKVEHFVMYFAHFMYSYLFTMVSFFLVIPVIVVPPIFASQSRDAYRPCFFLACIAFAYHASRCYVGDCCQNARPFSPPSEFNATDTPVCNNAINPDGLGALCYIRDTA